jgi:hypothetical protein
MPSAPRWPRFLDSTGRVPTIASVPVECSRLGRRVGVARRQHFATARPAPPSSDSAVRRRLRQLLLRRIGLGPHAYSLGHIYWVPQTRGDGGEGSNSDKERTGRGYGSAPSPTDRDATGRKKAVGHSADSPDTLGVTASCRTCTCNRAGLRRAGLAHRRNDLATLRRHPGHTRRLSGARRALAVCAAIPEA